MKKKVRCRLSWSDSALSCFRTADDTTLHAGRTSPETEATLCGEVAYAPFGIPDTKIDGLGHVLPWEYGAVNPPPHIDGGTWKICVSCVDESTTKKES